MTRGEETSNLFTNFKAITFEGLPCSFSFSSYYKQNFSHSSEDKLLLKDVQEEGFSIKLMYKGLDPSPAIEFPYRSVWNPDVPPKIGFFAWEATWGKVLTLDQHKCCGRAFANICFMCEEDEETIDHLLIHCKRAKTLWNLFFVGCKN